MWNDKKYEKIQKVKSRLIVNKSHLGKAGEYLVAGKLLLNGFNVYNTAIDDGIDLVARKTKKFYYFQVKTCQDVDYDSGKFVAKINLSSISKYPEKQTFVVLVLHYLPIYASHDYMGDHNAYEQQFIVLPIKTLITLFNKSDGNVVFSIYYSILMSNEEKYSWIVKLKNGKKELILDNYLIDSFWQVEI